VEKMDWCKYFRDIEDNPKAITPRITVRQLFEARDHLSGCDVCNNRMERVAAKAPKEVFPHRGEN
jgi:hypothetical protein